MRTKTLEILNKVRNKEISPVKANTELWDLFSVSFNDEGVEVCEHEYKHIHTNWYECTKCGYVTGLY
jgi:hypothetical protein